MELLAIIRRIDTDGDCEITMPEFAEFMTPIAPLPIVERHPLDFVPPPRAYSPVPLRPLTYTEEAIERSRFARSIGRTRPVVRHISPTRTVVVDEPVDPLYPLSRVPVDPYPLPRLSPGKPILRLYEEDELVHSLKE